MLKIGDLIEVPEVRTVIQLKDLQESGLRRMILDSFVVTDEVMKSLEMILPSLSGSSGRGGFLKGHFGSGKSHFLSILSLLLRHPEAREVLIGQESSLKDFLNPLVSRRFLVVEVSLIQHRGTEFLEDIFLKAVFRELSFHLGRPFEGKESRHETFQEIRNALMKLGFSGLVLLVDELSEFLRSKTDAHAYQEDIRFFQYLGEEAPSFPLWIIASLQEWIEETGEINQDTFNKIKDRYPMRISLGRSHIEEIVSHRLIRHREGAEEEIRKVFHHLRRYFPSFPVEESRFSRLYPVHPATITLLDRLKPLFSEHRGIVDFIHYRLKGDAERGIPSFLSRPAPELLGPATIFDHFIHRIREMAETQPFVEKGFDYYRDEIPQIFKDPDQQRVALEAVKLLILVAISPVKVRYTARHIAEMILFRVTDLEADLNYQYFRDILERLAKESSYLTVIPGKDRLDDQFSITLRADISGILRRKIRQGVTEIYPGDRRLFDRLLPLADSPHLPFSGWAEQREQRVSISWEYTRRNGMVFLRQVDEIPLTEAERLAGEWERIEEDFFLIVGTTHGVERQYKHLRDVLQPEIREKHPGTFLFWIPARIEEEEEVWMKELLSALLLLDRYREEPSESRQETQEFLKNLIDNGRKRLGEILTKAYFQGLLLWDDRQVELSAYGYLSQEKFLQEFIPPLLSRRFPRHHRVHPYLEALAPTTIPNLLRDFFATGTLEVDDRSKFGLRTILEGLLKPMGLIKKKGNQYLLHVDPRTNELAGQFLSLLEKGPLPPGTLYGAFRKGDYGLLKNQFEVLAFALLFSGNILAYQGQRRKGLEDISRNGLQGITVLGKGEILGEELRQIIPVHPLIPEKFRKSTFTLPAQEALWHEVKERKENEAEALRNLLQRLNWVSSFQALKNLPWDAFRRDVADVLAQWEEVKASFPPREGLERFLSASAREPFLTEKLQRLEELRSFFDHAEQVLFVYQYLSDPRLVIPERTAHPRLRDEKRELLLFFEAGNASIDPAAIQDLLQRFQDFRERYIQAYVEAHRRACSDEQFAPYEKVRHSRRYLLLSRLNQLEIISVQHNRHSVDRGLSSVLIHQCNAPLLDTLQRNPVCSCGFLLGTETTFMPAREIEEAIDLGILETVEALNAPTYQEKLIPYLNGLEEVGEKEKASAIRKLLALSPDRGEDFISRLDEALTPLAIEGINEAFRGRVVVVGRDLDHLYGALIRRKYTLSQARKIFREWLREEEISEGTFIQFIGRGEPGGESPDQEGFISFAETWFPHLTALIQESGQSLVKKALLVSLWIEGYEIPPQKIFPLFSFLEKGKEERGKLLVQQLSEAAKAMRQREPALFEKAVQEVEREEGLLSGLWRLLEGENTLHVFRREAIFPSILRKTFEKLLALPEEEKESAELSPLENSQSPLRISDFILKQSEMIHALTDHKVIRQKLQTLKRRETHPPQDSQKWESFYIQHLSPLSFLMTTFLARVERMGIDPPSPVRERMAQADHLCGLFSRGFSEFYGQALPKWEAGEGKRPTMAEDLPSPNFWKGILSEGAQKILVLMDGMRWDLWEFLKEKFFGPMGNQLRIVHEGALWAHSPSSTPAQMAFLEKGIEKTGAEGKRIRILKIGGIDERVHTEKGTLEHLFRNVLQFLELDLAPRLRELPPQTSLLFFSDHGFIENPHFEKSDKYRTSRYMHGEDSPFEVIVPWASVIKYQ
ncbi:MAG: DUF6079 family protein [Thermodesulfobacteriota bacterium]|nr:DUF6079 family protein [Thermodesulfobacteriota bacterium]